MDVPRNLDIFVALINDHLVQPKKIEQLLSLFQNDIYSLPEPDRVVKFIVGCIGDIENITQEIHR